MVKRILCFMATLLAFVPVGATSLTISGSEGWLESAYVKWLPVDSAESYNVYYSGEGITAKKIDNQLIRNYGTYYRADVLGLKAGKYIIKVVPVISGKENAGAVTDSLTVEAYDRTGFAFSNERIPGAYNADGTPKDGAVILYITENTKNTVSMDVTGADANPCVGLQAILDGFKKGKDTRPLIVRFIGQITYMAYMNKGDIVVENDNIASSYITLEGVGDDAVADGWGIRVKNATNIEIRNIGVMNCNSNEGDDIGLQQNNDHIWVHNCDLFYGMPGSDADQVKGDGAVDVKKSTYVTVSYDHFWDTGKSSLLGLSEDTTGGLYITYHHNWFDHSDSRHPRVRFYSAHVYNNYYDGNSKYGVGATMGSSVFVEANYFRNCKYPMLISMQGSDVYDGSTGTNDYVNMPTFSKEDGGSIKAYNNFMTGQHRFISYGDPAYPNSTVDFDAFVATTRNEKIDSTVVSFQGGNTYNNFDTDSSVMYAYKPDSPEAAREKVMKYAGRVDGGDFKWTFDNAVDDTSYAVNTALKEALVSYKTSLVSIQGINADSSGNNSGSSDSSGTDQGGVSSGDLIQNFTLSGISSTFYNITGNLSDSKGTVKYAGLILTQCLKIESSTVISFTIAQEATLTLVFNTDFSGKINLNGTSYNATVGVLTMTIPAGAYEITKGDVANLYYMSVAYANSDTGNSSGNTGSGLRIANKTEFTLYPNPVTNDLTISSDARVQRVEIYNLTGVLVKTFGADTRTINLSDLIHGSYLVKVFTDQGVFRKQVVKR